MKKLPIALCLMVALLPNISFAEENAELNATEETVVSDTTQATDKTVTANVKRLAIEYLNHSVTNRGDPNYPDSYSDDEQTSLSGVFDGNVVYDRTNMVWTNGLYAIYGKSETTEDDVTTKNESDDEILIYTDYMQKVWNLEHGVVGPFAYLGYETEFTTFDLDGSDYRTKIVRAKAGMKLYDGTYFKQLYVAAVEEDDMTYGEDNMKTGGEIGYEFNYPLNPDTTFISEGYYRHFFSSSEKEPTDFKYRLKLDNRIEVKLVGDLYMAPFYNYEIAETRGASKARTQSTMGLSLTYNKSFELFK